MRESVVLTILCLSVWPLACGPTDSNERPAATISVDEDVVPVGQEVFLDGSESVDPDSDPLIYRWSLRAPSGSAAELGNGRAQRVSFTPDIEGDYTVQLTVDDGALESQTESVIISARVMDNNEPPVADAGTDITTEPEQTVKLDATGSTDPDGDTLTFAWSIESKPSGTETTLDDPTVARPSFVPDVAGSYIFEVVVSDTDGESDSDMVVVEVVQVNPNDPPMAEAGEPVTVEAGTEVRLDGGESSDPNGDPLAFQWTLDSAPDSSSGTIKDPGQQIATFTPDVAGEYVFSLTVDDGNATDSDTVTISAEPPLPCLIIGEMYEGASFDKAVEIYNCGDSTVELSDFGVCLVQNADTTCSRDFAFVGQLAAGATRVVCHPDFAWNTTQSDACTTRDTVANFNGDDRMYIFEDIDGTGSYTSGDLVVDAFGEIANQPTSKPWEAADYRRCNFEQYDGSGAFDHTNYYEKLDTSDKSHLGRPPSEGCP
jgi:hypothetical protein